MTEDANGRAATAYDVDSSTMTLTIGVDPGEFKAKLAAGEWAV